MAERIRLVVVEDNQGFREALELLLGLQADMEVVASVADGSSAAAVVREHQPDVAVVCLTASANLREVDALFEAGAVACLSKDQELDEIIQAIRDAA